MAKKKLGRPTKAPEEKKVVFGVSLRPDLVETLKASAADRGLSHLVEQILEEAVKIGWHSKFNTKN